jgi:hypothetical protein
MTKPLADAASAPQKERLSTLIHFRPDYARNWRSGDIVHIVLGSPAPLKGPVTAADVRAE